MVLQHIKGFLRLANAFCHLEKDFMAWAMTEERRGLLRPVWGGVDPSIEVLAVV